MNQATRIVACAAVALAVAAQVVAAPLKEEHVTGGALDQVWNPGFDTPNNMEPGTLDPSHPAYANPSGDHTVAVATNAIPDLGGIIVTTIDVGGLADYSWEGWMFTGDGNTRRGIIVRATPAANAHNFYMLVIESGLFQVRFRKLLEQTPTTLGSWFTNTFPGGVPQVNTWHKMKILAVGSTFRCWWDDYELTGGTSIVDADLPTGNVGCYNFRFDLGQIPVYYDDLLLNDMGTTPVVGKSWAEIKALYR
jgi:hypothetical protein